jgi:hypothetical protein
MPLLKKSVPVVAAESDEEIAVLIEPKPGFSDEQVAESLRARGGVAVIVLGRGFVSARAPREVLDQIADMAWIHVKREKQPRSA